jgi:putative aldouronate transport system permease protein
MYFGGGLIPSFLVVKNLGLLNKPFTLVFLGGISINNTIVTRIYYQTSIPNELNEAAKVDVCSKLGMFLRIELPLSAPIIAVMTLFYAVDRWNDFFTALIYISDSRFYPLQLVLRNILIQSQMALQTLEATASDEEVLGLTQKAYMAEAMKYALIFIASAPMLIAYPFVQKHFVKGIMIGSLKG